MRERLHIWAEAPWTAGAYERGLQLSEGHIIPEARIHYAYIDAGGTAPNVVQDHATVRYEVRAPYVSQVKELYERVVNVAKGRP